MLNAIALSFFNGFTVDGVVSRAVLRCYMKHATIPCRADIRICNYKRITSKLERGMRGWCKTLW